MGSYLVLVGGGHAHMMTLSKIHEFVSRGHRVTVIGPSAYHYYSGMGPGMLSEIYTPEEIRFATEHVVVKQGGTFVRGKVTHIDPGKRLIFSDTGQRVSYDVLSFNSGSFVPRDSISDGDSDIYTAKPIERLLEAQKRLLALCNEKRVTVGVVGGGAAAVELAGNAWRLITRNGSEAHRVVLFTGNEILERFPEKVRRAGRRSLSRRGIRIHENSTVSRVSAGEIGLRSGKTYPVDVIFLAVGVTPSEIFARSNLPVGPDGGLNVNEFLQCTEYPKIFGGGDCIYFEPRPLEKVGVYAVRQNPVLYRNLMASLENGPLMPFDPGGDYLLIFNMGDGTGIFYKKGVLLGGRLAFRIKDTLDRRFMRKFQSLE
ncbi:NADH dehydrogenase-like protein [Olavius algarvensis associated proteobacterium Delta 3]|nr:NADH dehydrogenase-like protein [Olavius algarvensis associated proteobacterium Delta 3]